MREDEPIAESCIAKIGGSIGAGLATDDTHGTDAVILLFLSLSRTFHLTSRWS